METLRQTILAEKATRNYSLTADSKAVSKTLQVAYESLVQACNSEALIDKNAQGRINIVADWLTGKGKSGLLLYGAYGTGKTTMLTAISYVLRHFDRNYLQGSAKSVIASSDDERYYQNRVIMIDELGREPITKSIYGNVSEPIVDIIVFREKKRYPTIIATNLTDSELQQRYGEYIYDRIRGSYSKIFYNDKSYR